MVLAGGERNPRLPGAHPQMGQVWNGMIQQDAAYIRGNLLVALRLFQQNDQRVLVPGYALSVGQRISRPELSPGTTVAQGERFSRVLIWC